jgi:hypothetical protein
MALLEMQNEYLRIDDSTAIESIYRFYRAIVEVFGPHYLRRPNLTWSHGQMWELMNACVCLRNMIIESERVTSLNDYQPYDFVSPLATIDHYVLAKFVDFLAINVEIRDVHANTQLQNNLVERL